MNNENWMNSAINEGIKPVSVNIYYEDNKPYLHYIGETTLTNGYRIQIEVPKMSLELNRIDSVWEDKSEYKCKELFLKTYMYEVFVGNDSAEKTLMKMTVLERTTTKEELEKELGYKINLIE